MALPRPSRRELFEFFAFAAAAAALQPSVPAWAATADEAAAGGSATNKCITCFYQFNRRAIELLKGALPQAAGYCHIFSNSAPSLYPRPELAALVASCGSAFKYAPAFDVGKHKGWLDASDATLKEWAVRFRAGALDRARPADFFAFNEMPTSTPQKPKIREQTMRLLRHLADPGDGHKLPGILYLTERCLQPDNWVGETAEFWKEVDQTCDYVVGEHYHSYAFTFAKPAAESVPHLSAFPNWLAEMNGGGGGSAAGRRIATDKYIVLHSSYYGPSLDGWAGVNSKDHKPEVLEGYFDRLMETTRLMGTKNRRIGFGPLLARDLDVQALEALAKSLPKWCES